MAYSEEKKKAKAHQLPYADGFFDAAISVNSYQFFGTADTYFNEYFGKLVKRGGQIGFALPGIYREFEGVVPDYLEKHWWPDFYINDLHAFVGFNLTFLLLDVLCF